MTSVRRYWWVVPAVLAGGYWIWRARYLQQYDTLIVAAVVLAIVLAVFNVINPARRRRETDTSNPTRENPDADRADDAP